MSEGVDELNHETACAWLKICGPPRLCEFQRRRINTPDFPPKKVPEHVGFQTATVQRVGWKCSGRSMFLWVHPLCPWDPRNLVFTLRLGVVDLASLVVVEVIETNGIVETGREAV